MGDKKIRKRDCVKLSNKIIDRCELPIPRITSIDGIRSNLFVSLLQVLYHRLPEGIIETPTSTEEEVANVQAIINHLALDLIHIDLSHISGADVIAGDPRAIYNLLEIFCGLHKYLSSTSIGQWNLEETLTETDNELSSAPSSSDEETTDAGPESIEPESVGAESTDPGPAADVQGGDEDQPPPQEEDDAPPDQPAAAEDGADLLTTGEHEEEEEPSVSPSQRLSAAVRASASVAAAERVPSASSAVGRPPSGVVRSSSTGSATRVPSVGSGVARVSSAGSGVVRVPSAGSGVARVPSAGSGVARVPSAGSGVVRVPSAGSGVDKVASSGSAAARVPSSGSGVERMPSSGSAAARVPSSSSAAGRVPSSGSGVERVPSSGSAAGRVPSSGSAAGRVPSSSSAAGRVPSSGSGVERVPSSGSAAGRVPSSGSGVNRVPSSGSAAGRVPSVGSGVERVPSNGSAAGRVPSSSSAAGRVPSSGSGVERIPSSGSAAGRVPSSGSGVNGVPSSGSAAGRVPSSGSGVAGVPSSGSGVARVASSGSAAPRQTSSGSGPLPASSATSGGAEAEASLLPSSESGPPAAAARSSASGRLARGGSGGAGAAGSSGSGAVRSGSSHASVKASRSGGAEADLAESAASEEASPLQAPSGPGGEFAAVGRASASRPSRLGLAAAGSGGVQLSGSIDHHHYHHYDDDGEEEESGETSEVSRSSVTKQERSGSRLLERMRSLDRADGGGREGGAGRRRQPCQWEPSRGSRRELSAPSSRLLRGRRSSSQRSTASEPGGGRRDAPRNVETIAEIRETDGERAITETTREQAGDQLQKETVRREVRRKVSSAPHPRPTVYTKQASRHSVRSDGVSEWLDSQADDTYLKVEGGEADVFEYLRREFPYVHLSAETRRRLMSQYRKQMKYVMSLVEPVESRKIKMRRQDVLKRQALLTDILRQQKAHDRRFREMADCKRREIKIRNMPRDSKISCLRAQRYVCSFQQQFQSRSAYNKSKEELLLRAVFEEMLEIQRSRLRAVRRLERQAIQEFYDADGYTSDLNRMHQYYEANFRELAGLLARERADLMMAEREQSRLDDRIRREFRDYIEADVRSLNDKIVNSWQPQYRELDADRVRSDLYQANWKFCVS